MIYCWGENQALEDDAKGILSLLWNSYPGHPWGVWCHKGLIYIRHLGFEGQWGMSLRLTEFDHDAAVLKKKIVMAAGEWLERAGFKRGRYDDQEYTKVEGVPDREQPHQPLENMKIVMNEADLRDEARPQVGRA